MFSENLLETSWAERGRRSWTTLISFGLQAVIIALLMLIPLWATVGLRFERTVSTPIRMSTKTSDSGPTPHLHQGGRPSRVRVIPYTGRILAPGRLPYRIHDRPGLAEQLVAPGAPGIGSCAPFAPGLAILTISSQPSVPVAAKSIEKIFRKSEILEGSLIRKVEPRYPPLAMAARIQGPVVLEAVISKAGKIENLRLVSGHPMLAGAAIDAVSQWRYRPYILNGDGIEVETEITVNFVLEP